MSRNITLAFDFDINPEAIAELLRRNTKQTTTVVLGYGEHINGIPLNTIAVIARNETGNN